MGCPDRLTSQFQETVSQGTSGHPSPGTVSVLAYRAEAVCLEKCIGVNFCLWSGLVRPPCIEPPLHNNSSTAFSSHPLSPLPSHALPRRNNVFKYTDSTSNYIMGVPNFLIFHHYKTWLKKRGGLVRSLPSLWSHYFSGSSYEIKLSSFRHIWWGERGEVVRIL